LQKASTTSKDPVTLKIDVQTPPKQEEKPTPPPKNEEKPTPANEAPKTEVNTKSAYEEFLKK
jgi:hypothetical protein